MKRQAEFEITVEIVKVIKIKKRVPWGANHGDEEGQARSEVWEKVQTAHPGCDIEVIAVTDLSWD